MNKYLSLIGVFILGLIIGFFVNGQAELYQGRISSEVVDVRNVSLGNESLVDSSGVSVGVEEVDVQSIRDGLIVASLADLYESGLMFELMKESDFVEAKGVEHSKSCWNASYHSEAIYECTHHGPPLHISKNYCDSLAAKICSGGWSSMSNDEKSDVATCEYLDWLPERC